MKAQRCSSPLQAVVGVLEGKAGKPSTRAEATQVLMYLDRLQQLVPHCPKDRPLPRLELIQAVIDYICDLQDQLAEPPALLPDHDARHDAVFDDEPPEAAREAPPPHASLARVRRGHARDAPDKRHPPHEQPSAGWPARPRAARRAARLLHALARQREAAATVFLTCG